MDLSQPAAVTDVAQKIIADLGVPDILINNAGAGRWLTIEQTEASELEQMMMMPYFAAFNLTRELLPHMQNRGSGHIINVTSPASFLVWPGAAGYAAARAAMASFSKSLQHETHPSGINVTLAVFGKVASSYWQHNPGSEDQMPKVNTYLPTLTPQKVASAIVKAINRNRQLVIEPKILRPLFFFNSIAPGITGKILRMGWKGGI